MSEIKSVKRAIDILDVYGQQGGEIGVTEVARRLRMNKSTVTRVMSTLQTGGYLAQDRESRKYRLGGKILALSAIMLSTMEVRGIAAPYIRELSKRINETVDIYITEGEHRVCIDRIESTHDVRTSFRIGNRATLYAGAPGKVLLAFLPDEKREEVIQHLTLKKLAANTITDKHKLRKELDKIRKLGVSISLGEILDMFTGISVPIRDHTGEVVAAIGVSGLSVRFTPETIKEYLSLAKQTAKGISKELGNIVF